MTPTLHVAAACDESYAMPLAVMLASLSENLPPSRHARVYILQRQLTHSLRRKIERSVNPGAFEIRWIDVAPDRLASLRATLRSFDTVSLESYYRLLLPGLLPHDLDKVLYLDSDLVVTRDPTPLWELDVSAISLFAAPELAPAASLVSSPAGILLFRELGLPPGLKFFNSGVMLINLRKWRDEHVALRAFLYLETAREYLRWHDQEALNAILAGDWRELDPCWNVTMHLFRKGADPSGSRDLLRDPRIVHYNSAIKPWQPDFSLGFKDLFFHYLEKTAWSGWRPDHRPSLPARLKKRLRRAAQKRYHIASSRIRVLSGRTANRLIVRRQVPRIDANPVPSGTRTELRAFVDVSEPGPALGQLLMHYDELGTDRLFLLVGKDRVAEARSLASTRVDLHVVARENEDSHSVHLLLRSLLKRFAQGHWCLLLGSNELFYYPEAETLPLRDFCRRLDAGGFEAVAGTVFELAPLAATLSPSRARPDLSFLQWGDSRLAVRQDTLVTDTIVRDPVTHRIFPARLLLDRQQGDCDGDLRYRSKVALFKFGHGMSIAHDFRAVHGVRLAHVQAAVLRIAGGIADVPPWSACRGVSRLPGAATTRGKYGGAA